MSEDAPPKVPKNPLWSTKLQATADKIREGFNKQPPPTITELQTRSLREQKIDDAWNFFVVKDTIPVPEQDAILQHLMSAVHALSPGITPAPGLQPVEVEWIGQRHDSGPTPEHLDVRQGLEQLWRNCTRDLTIMHVHGGNWYQGDPRSYRKTTSQLARLSGGRVVSIRYRLAPQHAFPAALLDVFLVYLSLLHPSPTATSPHAPIAPSRIVLAGDSSGATLINSLLQVLRHVSLHSPSLLPFHTHSLPHPLPGPTGVALQSPAGAQITALPSHARNRVNDIFPADTTPWLTQPAYPSCALWPAAPPRPHLVGGAQVYASALVSSALAQDWRGAPPMWFGVGQEMLVDGARAVARRAARQGVRVAWVEFEAMPHCFAALPGFGETRAAARFMEMWAGWCVRCVERGGWQEGSERPRVEAGLIRLETGEEEAVELDGAGELELEEVERRMLERVKYEAALFEQKQLKAGAKL